MPFRRFFHGSDLAIAMALMALLGVAYYAVRPRNRVETKPAVVATPISAVKIDPAKIIDQGPLGDIILGRADAPVTIIEYASMTCSHCAHFSVNTFPVLKRKYIDTGKAKFILREFSSDTPSTAAFMLGRCMPQSQFYSWTEAVFQQQRPWMTSPSPREYLSQTSRFAGMTQASFAACLSNQALFESMNAARDRANRSFGVEGTPTFFINGSRYVGVLSVDEISDIIDHLL